MNSEHQLVADTRSFEGHQISWAGNCLWTGDLCFGDESGNLIFSREGGASVTVDRFLSGTINGAAFSESSDKNYSNIKRYFTVTSRDEVKSGYIKNGEIQFYNNPFRGGAHGAIATSNGAVLAPVGTDGILIVKYEGEEVRSAIVDTPNHSLNYYRIVRLAREGEKEIFACAARLDGIVLFTLQDTLITEPPVQHSLGGLDIVDVCAMGNPTFPFATAWLSRDRKLFMTSDLTKGMRPFALDLHQLIKGVGYTILCSQGHVFILTESQFVTFPDLAKRYLVLLR